MFDFRYHALSLAAVFIALVVGLLLGVAIGDKELVSGARQELRDSLRADVRKADQERDEAKARVREQDAFADAAYPILTAGQLPDARIGLVLLGDDDGAPDIVRDALEPTGADLAFVAVVRQSVDLADDRRARPRHALREHRARPDADRRPRQARRDPDGARREARRRRCAPRCCSR